MNVDKLREQLKIDEGVKYEIYNDHLGYATFGIGHLVVEGDQEHGQPVGTPVTEERVNSVFDSDVELYVTPVTFTKPSTSYGGLLVRGAWGIQGYGAYEEVGTQSDEIRDGFLARGRGEQAFGGRRAVYEKWHGRSGCEGTGDHSQRRGGEGDGQGGGEGHGGVCAVQRGLRVGESMRNARVA